MGEWKQESWERGEGGGGRRRGSSDSTVEVEKALFDLFDEVIGTYDTCSRLRAPTSHSPMPYTTTPQKPSHTHAPPSPPL